MSQEPEHKKTFDSRINTIVESSVRIAQDMLKIGVVSIIPAFIISVLVPAYFEKKLDSELVIRETVFHNLPVVVGISSAIVSLRYVRTSKSLFWSAFIILFLIGAAADISDMYGCKDCGGRVVIDEIKSDTNEFFHTTLHDIWIGPFGLIIWLWFTIRDYAQLYGAIKFISALIGGTYLGISILWIFRPGKKNSSQN